MVVNISCYLCILLYIQIILLNTTSVVLSYKKKKKCCIQFKTWLIGFIMVVSNLKVLDLLVSAS